MYYVSTEAVEVNRKRKSGKIQTTKTPQLNSQNHDNIGLASHHTIECVIHKTQEKSRNEHDFQQSLHDIQVFFADLKCTSQPTAQ